MMNIPLPPLSRSARILIAALFGYVVLLLCLAATLDDGTFLTLFSEEGLFEECSIAAWIFAAIVVLRRAWQCRGNDKVSYLAHAGLFALCAMREADWHKKFTTDGILKIKYYTRSAAALSEKIPAALISLLFIALLIHALVRCFRYAKTRSHLALESTWVMMTGISLFFVGKILDRSISVLTETFGVSVSPWVKKLISAQEEGLEMVGPVFIALAFFWPSHTTDRTNLPS